MSGHYVVGTGRWGTWLARRLAARGARLAGLLNRSPGRARGLAAELGSVTLTMDQLAAAARGDDYVWLCVPDEALLALHDSLAPIPRLAAVVQASGASSHPASPHCVATCWPIQSISAVREPDWAALTCVVDGGSADKLTALLGVVERHLSPGRVVVSDEATRLRLHLAATLTQNFGNHLWEIAERVLAPAGLGLAELLPLAQTHLEALAEGRRPVELQTGPALRGDVATMQRHLGVLGGEAAASEIYEVMSRAIAGARGSGGS